MDLDYRALGLKVGLEIHQELKTHKLFCSCPSVLRDENPPMTITRRLRPTQSEMGEVDRAAMAEALKGKSFHYQLYPDTVCLVEMDEEPPHPIDDEILDTALQICLLLNAKPVDEIHVMRKIVIDGSNTSGFQRTALIATDGWVEVDGKRYTIQTVCLEEDAARKVKEFAEFVDYRLDRLGIPLVEVATGAEFSDPETPARVAFYIGQLMRATGKVKRGLGTIRQDINISIAKGARQEIKGIQELELISEVIRREVQRQLGLIEIANELRKRGAVQIRPDIRDVSDVFSSTECKIIREALRRGGRVLAVVLPRFAGLVGKEIQPGRRLGTEFADHAKLYGKVRGIFHTDELPAYGVSEEETSKLREALGAGELDAVVLVADQAENARRALEAVVARANQAIAGVPEETRRALPDGNTEFMRPLPGAARMYPETDIPPRPITPARIRKLKKTLPELPEQKMERYQKLFNLNPELAHRIVSSDFSDLFESIVRETGADPTLVVTTLTETLTSLRREGIPVDRIQDSALLELFKRQASGNIAKEAIPDLLSKLAEGQTVDQAIEELKITAFSEDELRALVQRVLKEREEFVRKRGESALKPLMGVVMAEVRGRIDGKTVHSILLQELKRFLNSSLPNP